MPRPTPDISNERFGLLVALRRVSVSGEHHAYWLCRCDCGKTKILRAGHLRTSGLRSCGCLRDEIRLNGGNNRRHWATRNHKQSREYKSWCSMIYRCTNPNSISWKNYGAKGVTVCEAWRVFEVFLAHMRPRPAGTSIDRINPYGNYEPGNCRWATRKEQRANQRSACERIS
jgi:hypothetical protein